MSLSRYDASNAMNCKPRPSEASEHAPKFTPLGGSCCKGDAERERLADRGRCSGWITVTRQRAEGILFGLSKAKFETLLEVIESTSCTFPGIPRPVRSALCAKRNPRHDSCSQNARS